MKTAVLALAEPKALVLERSRFADYLTLTKPRIAVLVLFTVAAGAWLAGGAGVDPLVIVHTVLGTALVASGASALNQLLERKSDALMQRTEDRPLPAGRLQAGEVFFFGMILGIAGVAWLAIGLQQWLTPALAAFTFAAYVGIYTPLKSRTTLNTLVGAVPGALPPVIGWTAVRNSIDYQTLCLFGIVFLWQVPHFLAIAWIYRAEYARAGLKMLPVVDRSGEMTGRQMTLYTLALVAASLMPVWTGAAGLFYAFGVLALGVGFLTCAAGFAQNVSDRDARRVLRFSLLYLPGLLALLIMDRWLPLAA